jgi:hypothetical protein
MTIRAKAIGYWTTTLCSRSALLSGGAAELARRADNVEGMLHLGYRCNFITIIGFWKSAWGDSCARAARSTAQGMAYAGAFFNMTGAVASHAMCGDSVGHLIAPGVIALLTVASWALRPQSRIVGVLCPSGARQSVLGD